VGVHVCVGVLGSMFSVYLYFFACLGCMYSVSDLLGEIQTVAGNPDSIRIRTRCGSDTQRFEDRSMRWSVDQYQFVQWRPDSDSVPKPRHFMWVFVYWSIFNSNILSYHFMWICIWFLHYFTHVQQLLYCDALALFYWYVIYTVIKLVQYSKYMSIRHNLSYW